MARAMAASLEMHNGVRCYLWLDGVKLTSTLKGKGTKSLPIQYK